MVKIKVSSHVTSGGNYIARVSVNDIIYEINFDLYKVKVLNGEWKAKDFLEFSVNEEYLPIGGFGQRSIILADVHTFWRPRNEESDYSFMLRLEYFEDKEKLIPEHSHPEGVREAYLAVDYAEGRVCGYEQQHKPFADRHVAVKLFWEYLM